MSNKRYDKNDDPILNDPLINDDEMTTDSDEPVDGMPPGLIVRSYLGQPNDVIEHKCDRLIYDLYFNGNIEVAVDHEWLMLISDVSGD